LFPDVPCVVRDQAGAMTDNTATNTTFTPTPTTRPPLRRSTSDRVLGGVAGGFAQWLGIDPAIVRVILVVLAIFGGSGVVLYVVGWLFIPEEGRDGNEATRMLDRAGRPGSSGRIVLIVMAAIAALIVLGWISSSGPWHTFGGGSVLLLLAVGGTILWLLNRTPSPVTATAPGPMDVSAAGPDTDSAPTAVQPAYLAAPVTTDAPPTGFAYGGSGGGYPGYVPATPPPPPAPPRPRSYLGLVVLSIAVIAMGLLVSIDVAGLADIPAVVILSTGLGLLGIGLIVGAFVGRAKWLIAVAVPLLMFTAIIAVVPSNLRLGTNVTVGDRMWRPTTAAQATTMHKLGVGQAVLDLRDLPAGTVLSDPIQAYVGMGDLKVIVPSDMNVAVAAKVGLGEIDLEGLAPVDGRNPAIVTTLPGSTSTTNPPVDLIVEAGIGSLEVSRA
jgi:phage shock protein PspC (stress-responsive transcriptional regulator)